MAVGVHEAEQVGLVLVTVNGEVREQQPVFDLDGGVNLEVVGGIDLEAREGDRERDLLREHVLDLNLDGLAALPGEDLTARRRSGGSR